MKMEGPTIQAIRSKLTVAFSPVHMEVIDDSDRHAGHMGARPGGETHFTVILVAEAFEGLSRLQRQRRINKALESELAGPVHALSIRAQTPQEARALGGTEG
jgi:BolA protein